ncbi:MAG: hypothetical protein RIA38_00365 [Microcella pacifica]
MSTRNDHKPASVGLFDRLGIAVLIGAGVVLVYAIAHAGLPAERGAWMLFQPLLATAVGALCLARCIDIWRALHRPPPRRRALEWRHGDGGLDRAA